MKTLENQIKELKKQLGDEIAVKIITKKNKLLITQIVTKGDSYDNDDKEFSKIRAQKKSLIETKNYIG